MKAAGYVRVSTTTQAEEGVSLDAQREKIKAYCSLKDFDLIEIVEDAGISAKNMNRPGLQRVLDMAKNREVDALIVFKMDRMFRNTIDALETTKLFDKWGIDFHSISESISTKSPMGKFFFTLLAALGQMERELIGERTRAALAHKRSQNERLGGHIPYGYRMKDGKLVEDMKEQKIIGCIRYWKKRKGMSFREVCDDLNKQGIPTRTGGKWHPGTISRILARK